MQLNAIPYFGLRVRVARLPRHGGSYPVGIGASCSADRQVRARFSADGVFLEQLEEDPAKYLSAMEEHLTTEVHRIDLNDKPLQESALLLSKYPYLNISSSFR